MVERAIGISCKRQNDTLPPIYVRVATNNKEFNMTIDKNLKADLYGALGMTVPTKGTVKGSVRQTTEEFTKLITAAIKPSKKGNVMVHLLKPEDFNGKVNNSKGDPATCGIDTLVKAATKWAEKNKGYSVEKIRQNKRTVAVAVVKSAK